MTSNTSVWLYGLIAAFIGGCAGAIDSGLTLIIAAPESFNLGPGLRKTVITTGVLGLLTGIKFLVAYLKQSPLPKGVWSPEDRAAVQAGILLPEVANKRATAIAVAADAVQNVADTQAKPTAVIAVPKEEEKP